MKITQAYVSKSISDFPFHDIYKLEDYNSIYNPVVFFGCYRFEDRVLISNHKGAKIIFWTGQDAIDYNWADDGVNESVHITAHPKIHELFTSKGKKVKLVKPSPCLNFKNAQQLGTKIYAYCPKSAQTYHGFEFIEELKKLGYDIVIGDGSHTQEQWKYLRNGYYNDCFIGLCLSPFAGGAGSVIEMGLRGMPVITNVLNLPNCLHFETLEDIVYLIEQNKQRIGTTDEELAQRVFNALDHSNQWLKI